MREMHAEMKWHIHFLTAAEKGIDARHLSIEASGLLSKLYYVLTEKLEMP